MNVFCPSTGDPLPKCIEHKNLVIYVDIYLQSLTNQVEKSSDGTIKYNLLV